MKKNTILYVLAALLTVAADTSFAILGQEADPREAEAHAHNLQQVYFPDAEADHGMGQRVNVFDNLSQAQFGAMVQELLGYDDSFTINLVACSASPQNLNGFLEAIRRGKVRVLTLEELADERPINANAFVYRLRPVLGQQDTLSSLTLRGINLTGPQLEGICGDLADYEPLREIHVDRNPIGAEGIEAMRALVDANPHITGMSLAHPGLADDIEESLTAFLRSVRQRNTLSVLNLSGNVLTQDHVDGIADLIRSNGPLDTLLLEDCDLADDHLAQLTEALQENRIMTNMFIYPEGDVRMNGINDLLERNRAPQGGNH